jgi:predicted anti-sigma-YlaC factor YlaD
MIRCGFYRGRMARVLDEGAEPGESLRAHLAACPACRARYEAQQALVQRLRHEPAASLSHELRYRILRRLEERTRPPVRRAWPRAAAIAAGLAVALTLAILALALSGPFPPAAPRPPVVQVNPSAFPGLPAVLPAEDLPATLAALVERPLVAEADSLAADTLAFFGDCMGIPATGS